MSPATFTHHIPDGPVLISPEEGEAVELDAVVISWEPVTGPADVNVVRYELFLSPIQPSEGDPPPLLVIDLALELPSTVTGVRIPREFLAPDTDYEFEVLSIKVSGKKTITAGEFVTAAPP